MTGIELITAERIFQLFKGQSIDDDVRYNPSYQLKNAARYLLMNGIENTDSTNFVPSGWDIVRWRRMFNKPYIERLMIAGALIAAEIDRLQHKEENE